MANESILELILRIKKQGKGVPEAGVELKGLDDIVGGLKKKVVDLAGPAGMAALAGVMIHSVKVAAEYGDNMGDLAQLTGATVEETSRLNTVMEIAGMKTDNLSTVIKSMTKSGLQLNIQTLRRLSAEYQAIQDPIAKNEFLFKKFGKAGADMAELMGKTSAELDELAAAADRSGKVINEGIAEEAENLNIRINELKASSDGLFIKWGNNLIPTADALAQAMQYLTRQESDFNDEILESWGVHLPQNIDATKAAWRESEHFAVAQGAVYTHAMMAADAVGIFNTSNVNAAIAANEARDAVAREADAAGDLAFGMGEATKATIFNLAAQNLSAEGAYNLAKSMGLIDEKADSVKQIMDEYKRQLDAGEISAGLYAQRVRELATVADTVNGKVVTITYIEQYRREFQQEMDRGDDRVGGAIGDGYASGGTFGPGPMIVGEKGPELMFPQSGGYVMNNQDARQLIDAMQSLASSFSGGMNVNVSAGSGLVATVSRGMAARARAARNSGAAWQGRD